MELASITKLDVMIDFENKTLIVKNITTLNDLSDELFDFVLNFKSKYGFKVFSEL